MSRLIKAIIELSSIIETEEREKQNPRHANLPQDATKHLIINMLTENTGANILDSGGYYGRHWEANRKVQDWDKIPPLVVDIDTWKHDEETETSINVEVNLYSYLEAHLLVSKKSEALNKAFWDYVKSDEDAGKDTPYLDLIQSFLSRLNPLGVIVDQGGDNTYNHPNILSQNFEIWCTFFIEDEYYIIISTHNGCDIRGGYSKPRIFYVGCEEEVFDFLTHIAYLEASCKRCKKAWISEDAGYSFSSYTDEDGDEDDRLMIHVGLTGILRKRLIAYHKGCGGRIEFSVPYL